MSSTGLPNYRHPVVIKVRQMCLERGGENGIRGLSRQFRIMDDDNSLRLNYDEFRGGLRDYGVVLTDEEFETVLSVFDANGDGVITMSEFLVALRGEMTPRRKAVVDIAFQRFDRDGSGTITLEDLKQFYDVTRHPDVLAGKMTKADALLGFLCLFDDKTNPDGRVTKEEFHQYYSGVSANIDTDGHFESLLIRAWNLDKPLKVVENPSTMKQPRTVDDLPGRRPIHPLYQTSTSVHGQRLEEAIVPPPLYNKAGKFTKNTPGPWRNSSLNVASEKSRVLSGTSFGDMHRLL